MNASHSQILPNDDSYRVRPKTGCHLLNHANRHAAGNSLIWIKGRKRAGVRKWLFIDRKGTGVETIGRYLANDHNRCDALFAQVETSIDEGKWEQAETAFQCFNQALERHLSMEEIVLFPAFEKVTGSSDGPTSVMRKEHQHIRAIASRLNDAVSQRNISDFFDHDDTLRIIMEQHNLEEETIFYFMTDRVLSGRQSEIIDAMDEIGAATPIE